MKRLLVTFFTVLVLAGSAGAGYVQQFEKVEPAVWRLYVMGGGGDLFFLCSSWALGAEVEAAVVRDKSTLVTAGHCAAIAEALGVEYRVTRDGKTFYEAKLKHTAMTATINQGFSREDLLKVIRAGKWSPRQFSFITFSGEDWAILEIGVDGPRLVPDARTPKIGTDLLMVGYPGGVAKMGTQGVFGTPSLFLPGEPWNGYFGYFLPSLGGSSGSPVVDAASGRVIAIHVIGFVGSDIGGGTPIKLLVDGLEKLAKK